MQGYSIGSVARFSDETDAELVELVFGATRSALKIYFCGLDDTGLDLQLVTGEAPLTLRVVFESFGLPELDGFQITPRPPASAPALRSNLTFVSQALRL